MNDLTKPQTGQLRRDIINRLTDQALPGYQPDRELLIRIKQNTDALKAAYAESRRALGLETDGNEPA